VTDSGYVDEARQPEGNREPEAAIEPDATDDRAITYAMCPSCGAVNVLRATVADQHSLSVDDIHLQVVLNGWNILPREVRSLIAATVRAHARPS
jgi:hypothetical protein